MGMVDCGEKLEEIIFLYIHNSVKQHIHLIKINYFLY